MVKSTLAALVVLTVATAAPHPAPARPSAQVGDFAGSTPCGEQARHFLGISNAACEQITWVLNLVEEAHSAGAFELRGRYHLPLPGSPNHLDAGHPLQLRGFWTSTDGTGDHKGRTIYTLKTDGRSARFALLERQLLHLLSADNRLETGNAGWSYTLNKDYMLPTRTRRRMEAVDPATIAASRTLGGTFEGRTPCREISKQLNLAADAGCIKLKWAFKLSQDASGRPTTYALKGTLYRDGRLQAAAPRTGKWSVLRDRTTGALIYRLERDEPGAYMLLMRAGENVLFFLDKEGNALVGNESFSYTLNRAGD